MPNPLVLNLIREEWRIFQAVVTFESMSRAAISLGLQQSAISKTIQRLEFEVGAKLFYRNRRGVMPSPRGLAVAQALKQILQSKDLVKISELQSEVCVAFHPAIAIDYLSTVISSAEQSEVLKMLKIKLELSRLAVEDVVGRKVDMAIVANPRRQSDLVIKIVARDGVGVYSQRENSHQHNHNQQRTLLFHPDMIGIKALAKQFKEFNQIEISDYEVIAATCKKSSNVVGLLPSHIATRHRLLLQGKILSKNTIALIYRHDAQFEGSVGLFKENLLRMLSSSAQSQV